MASLREKGGQAPISSKAVPTPALNWKWLPDFAVEV
jgi:hypothetical protein